MEEKKLGEKSKSYIEEHLREKTDLMSRGCQTCGSREFEVEHLLKYIPTVSLSGEVNLEHGAPYLEVVCHQCKKTHLFHATKMDIPELDL